MNEFEVSLAPGTFVLTNGSIALEAAGIIHDRGTLRSTLSIHQGERLIHRDNVNLTGDKARKRFLRRAGEILPGLALPEEALLALDEAIRRNPRVEANGQPKKHVAPSEFSGRVLSMADLMKAVRRWLLLEDEDLVPVTLGTIAAHRLGGESPWMLLIAPPSGTKTEILRMTWSDPGIYPISDLTSKTLASGLDAQGNDPSLLSRLKDEILCVKDMTTILEMRQEERQAVLAQLREIYDGRFDKTWGTGKELHWTGRLGFIAGVTPVIDQHHAVMGLLGPRFVQLRLKGADRHALAMRAMQNADQEGEMREELAAATAAFLSQLPTTPPEVPYSMLHWLAQVADLVTRGRSPVVRDGYRRDLEYAPAPEIPARLSRQLLALLKGVTLVCGRQEAGPEDARRIARVGLDCIPAMRRQVLETLSGKERYWNTTEVASSAQHSSTTVRRTLEDLQALGMVVCRKGGSGCADEWALTDESREMLSTVKTFSEEPRWRHEDPTAGESAEVWEGELPEWEG